MSKIDRPSEALQRYFKSHPGKERQGRFAALMEQVRNGSKEASEEVWREYGPYIVYLVRRYQSPQGDASVPGGSSVIQESYLDVAKDIRHFKGHTRKKLRAWIRKVVKNNWSDAQRRRARMQKVGLADVVPLDELEPDLQPVSWQAEPCDEIEQSEEMDAMQAALESLPEKVRAVVVLRHADGLTCREIAEKTGRSPKAVQKICARALTKLRRKLSTRQEAAVRRRPK